MRLEKKYLGLVSNPEILITKSRSRLELRDLEDKILVLISNLEIERDKILKCERTAFLFVGVVCKALIDLVARFLLPFSH